MPKPKGRRQRNRGAGGAGAAAPRSSPARSAPVAVAAEPGAGGAGVAVVEADPTREYISDGWLNFMGVMGVGGARVNALSNAFDDLSRDFGLRVYEEMMRDPQVAAAVNVFKLGILSQGVRLVNRYGKDDPKYIQAQVVLEFCTRNLFTPGRLERPFTQTLYELLDAIVYGHKAAEQTYELMEEGVDAGKLCLTSLKTKPLHSSQMVVDRFMNLLGLLAWSPSPGPDEDDEEEGDGNRRPTPRSRASARPRTQEAQGPNWRVLPRAKFVILPWKTKDSDPRGTSQIRPAYNAWNIKRQVWPEYLRFLAIYAIPMLLGKVGNTADVPIKNEQGQIVGHKRAIQALYDMLIQARNATVMAVNKEDEVDPIEVQGNGEAFTKAIEVQNREITMAILYQVRATNEAEHGSKADSQTAQDVLDLVIADGKEAVAYVVEADLLVPLVRYNFGSEGLELLPQVQLPDMPPQDRAQLMGALASLVKANYFHLPSQAEKLDAEFGFPARDMDAWLQERADQKAMSQALLESKAQGDQDEEDEETSEGGGREDRDKDEEGK